MTSTLLQEDEELSEPCGSEGGELMTPPQPAPRDSPGHSTSDAEMSFRDLVDESDEEDRAGHGALREKPNANGQVLVDPEDLQVGYRSCKKGCPDTTLSGRHHPAWGLFGFAKHSLLMQHVATPHSMLQPASGAGCEDMSLFTCTDSSGGGRIMRSASHVS